MSNVYVDDFFLSVRKSPIPDDQFYLMVEPYDVDELAGTSHVRLKLSVKNLRKLYNELTIFFAERDLLLPRHMPEAII